MLGLLVSPPPAQPQGTPAADPYREAVAVLESSDTAAALALLRAVVEEQPDNGPAHLRLGALLSARAPEAERDLEQRREARRHLDRAYRLLWPDPEVLLEYGLLLRKMSVGVDAKRVLERAWQAGEKAGDSFPPELRARLHYELARIFESWWEDWHGLVMRPFNGEFSCARGGTPTPSRQGRRVAIHVQCAKRWADDYDRLTPMEDLKSDDRERMIAHYLLALEADPAHTDAAVRVLGHLADAQRWELYDEVARNHVVHAPRDPRAHLMRGLGLHERGRPSEAAEAFERALDLMDPEQRRPFRDIGILLPRSIRDRYLEQDSAGQERTRRMWFTTRDPLYLTAVNERRLEHYARVAWSDLKFSSPASGQRGWDSEPGTIWIRYGRPWRWYRCCFGGPRTALWSYGTSRRGGPHFTFTEVRTYRKKTLSNPALASDLEAWMPQLYSPSTVTAWHPLPHQVASFRSSDGTHTRVEIYAAPPVDSLDTTVGTRMQAGIFTFLEDYTPVWEGRALADVPAGGVALTFRFDLPAGRYRYGLEARLDGPDSLPRPLAREREALYVPSYAPGALSVSDLLLASDSIRPTVPVVTRRDQLTITPLRGTVVRAGDPLHLYFEIYGLAAGEEDIGTYRAELSVEDSTRTNFAERLLRRGRDLLGIREEDPRVSWERQVAVGERIPEYITVSAPALDAGEYVIRLRLTDLVNGGEAERVRRVRVLAREDR